MGYIDKRGPLVYIAYDPKPPHLPIAVADSAQELAAAVGTTKDTVLSTACRARKGLLENPRYVQVEIGP